MIDRWALLAIGRSGVGGNMLASVGRRGDTMFSTGGCVLVLEEEAFQLKLITKLLALTQQGPPGAGQGHRGSEAEAPEQREGGGQPLPEEQLPGEGSTLP